MDVPVDKKHLVCIEYPGIVVNTDQMLKTLGGERNISKAYADPMQRLELRWRPNHIYSKPACGDRHSVTNLLLRVRRRKKTHQSSGSDPAADLNKEDKESDDYEYEGRILGVIDTVYKFQCMADLQYLPMKRAPDGSHVSVIDKLILSERRPYSWLNGEMQLHLPPPIFSRIDNPSDYSYKDDPIRKSQGKRSTENRGDVVSKTKHYSSGVARQRRPHYTLFAKFEDATVPTEPMQEAMAKLNKKLNDPLHVAMLEKLFQERPVWSKNAIQFHISMAPEKLKFTLPVVAYYFVTGPWRALWVRLGYDPRTDPLAKQYQLVDFRVRQKSASENLRISTKRSTFTYKLPNTVLRGSSQASLIQKESFNVDWMDANNDAQMAADVKESTFKFRPDQFPAYRQMFYQLCDIEVPEVQALVHQNNGQETTCRDKDGWCIPDIQEKCRAILANYVKQLMNTSGSPATDPQQQRQQRTAAKSKDESREDTESKSSTPRPLPASAEDIVTTDTGAEGQSVEPGEMEYDDDDCSVDDNDMESEMMEYMDPSS